MSGGPAEGIIAELRGGRRAVGAEEGVRPRQLNKLRGCGRRVSARVVILKTGEEQENRLPLPMRQLNQRFAVRGQGIVRSLNQDATDRGFHQTS